MEYRPLGRTGIQVSPLCFGTMMFGDKNNAEEASMLLDRAVGAGINFIDTANVYGRGLSEEITGESLHRLGLRDKVVLATKVHGKMSDTDPNSFGNTRRHIIAECEASLRRLKTDRIDLYQIHRPQPSVPIDETLRALDDLIRAGKVLHIGTSTFAAWQVVESLWTSKELHLNRFISEQPPYNLLERSIERELLPMARTFGMAVLPWSPLAGGLLTGKYRRNEPRPEGSRYEPLTVFQKRRYTPAMFDAVEALELLAKAKGCSLSQFSLAWLIQQTGVTAPIIGPRTIEQLEDNLASLSISLTPEDLSAIDSIVPPCGMVTPYYEGDFFSPHPHRI
jgi:aryl-alcohol dehydrogenase-like predicted oxidoreductase